VSVGYVFTEDGTHVATVVQEVLLRKVRRRTG
jgi:acyl-CoA thioesterase